MLRILQSHTRRHLAKRRGNRLAREKRSVIAVQCAYRSRKARLAAAYKRVIRYLSLLFRHSDAEQVYRERPPVSRREELEPRRSTRLREVLKLD